MNGGFLLVEIGWILKQQPTNQPAEIGFWRSEPEANYYKSQI